MTPGLNPPIVQLYPPTSSGRSTSQRQVSGYTTNNGNLTSFSTAAVPRPVQRPTCQLQQQSHRSAANPARRTWHGVEHGPATYQALGNTERRSTLTQPLPFKFPAEPPRPRRRTTSLAPTPPEPLTAILPAWLHFFWVVGPLGSLGGLGITLLYLAICFDASKAVWYVGIFGYFGLSLLSLRLLGLLMNQAAERRWLKSLRHGGNRGSISSHDRRISFAMDTNRLEPGYRCIPTEPPTRSDDVELTQWHVRPSVPSRRSLSHRKSAYLPRQSKRSGGHFTQEDISADLSDLSDCQRDHLVLAMHQDSSEETVRGGYIETQEQEVMGPALQQTTPERSASSPKEGFQSSTPLQNPHTTGSQPREPIHAVDLPAMPLNLPAMPLNLPAMPCNSSAVQPPTTRAGLRVPTPVPQTATTGSIYSPGVVSYTSKLAHQGSSSTEGTCPTHLVTGENRNRDPFLTRYRSSEMWLKNDDVEKQQPPPESSNGASRKVEGSTNPGGTRRSGDHSDSSATLVDGWFSGFSGYK